MSKSKLKKCLKDLKSNGGNNGGSLEEMFFLYCPVALQQHRYTWRQSVLETDCISSQSLDNRQKSPGLPTSLSLSDEEWCLIIESCRHE